MARPCLEVPRLGADALGGLDLGRPRLEGRRLGIDELRFPRVGSSVTPSLPTKTVAARKDRSGHRHVP